MFNGKIDLKQVSPNNEWKYLIRVILVIAVVLLVVYQLWFSWWVPSNQATPVKAESETSLEYVEAGDNIYIAKDTGDVFKCEGSIPNTCVRMDLNCSNIGSFDLWLRPVENLKRCQSPTVLKEQQAIENRNVPAIPICESGQRLWFVPETKQYFCK